MMARISNLHRTEAEWQKLASWIPEAGEFVVYDPDQQYNYARLKVGDGKSSLKELPFFIEPAILKMIQQQPTHAEILDGGRITLYKK